MFTVHKLSRVFFISDMMKKKKQKLNTTGRRFVCVSLHTYCPLSHVWSEITSKKQDGIRGVFRQSGLEVLHLVVCRWVWCPVCQHFKFASAAVQTHKMKIALSVRWLLFLFLFFTISWSFSSVAVFTVWSPLGRIVWTDNTETEASFVHSLFSCQTFCTLRRAGWDWEDNSVTPFRCDSESFKWASMHNNWTLVLLNGLQSLLILVTVHHEKCSFLYNGTEDDHQVQIADSR